MATAARSTNPTAMPTQMDEDAILREHDASEQRVIAELESAAPEAIDTTWGAALLQPDSASATPITRPRFARVESALVTTDDRHLVAELANELEEHPALFAIRFLELVRRVELLERSANVAADRLNGDGAERSIEDLRARMRSVDSTLAGLCMEVGR